jgi:ferredoxin-nitrite reductase
MEFLRPFRKTNQLSQVERWKLERHPLDVADAVVNRYAFEGPSGIEEVEGEAERLKWVGLYPQRQGGDAFMMRIKVPGGQLTAAQAKVVGEVTRTYARPPEASSVFADPFVDITTRQDLQLHWIRIEDVPAIWARLESVGMTTVQACGDSARNVLCCPVSGLDAAEVFDAYPAARAITDFFTGNREYANLPRKFKVSVTGCTEDCAQAEINDIGMWPARASDGRLGFNVLVGGGLSDGPRMASDIDLFVLADDAVEITRAIAHVYGELGNRENRGLSRMRYLVQELGPTGFREELAKRARIELERAGEPLTKRYRGDHIGVHEQRQAGLFYLGLNVTVGRISGSSFVDLADLAERYGDCGLRLTTDQNVVLTGVPEPRLDDLLAEPVLSVHSPSPGPFERGVVACTGSEFCRFAVVETKARAVSWARYMDERFQRGDEWPNGGGDGVVRMHFSGCPASCAQPQIADVGFRGDTAHVGEEIVEAADIGLGGSLGADAAFIDWVEGAMPVDRVPEALVRLVERYRRERRPAEAFHQWTRRVPNEDLRATLAGDGAVPAMGSAAEVGR